MTDKPAFASYITNGLAAILGVVTLQELGLIVGIALGVLTYFTNAHYKKRHDRREAEYHQVRMSEGEE